MILLQVGQAGLQVGQSLIENLGRENGSNHHIKYPLNTIDQLCIDTERKVCLTTRVLMTGWLA